MGGVRARQMCPQTCGCADPSSSLILSTPSYGCGEYCSRSETYASSLDAIPCTDQDADSDGFVTYLEELVRVSVSWPENWAVGARETARQLRQGGCGQIPVMYSWGNGNFCKEEGTFFPIKPMSYICPVTCGCSAGDAHCPSQCPENATRSW